MTISGLGPHGERAAPPERVSLLPDDRTAAKAAGWRVAVVLHTLESDWAKQQLAGMVGIFGDCGAAVIDVVDCGFSPDMQVAELDRLIAQRPDAIISLPVANEQVAAAHAACLGSGHQAGPAWTTRRPACCPASTTRRWCRRTISAWARSRRQGFRALPPKAQSRRPWLCRRFLRHQRTRDRLHKWLQANRADVRVHVARFGRIDEAGKLGDRLLAEHPALAGLFVVWDTPALAVAARLQEAGRSLPMATVDLGEGVAVDLASRGSVRCIAAQLPYQQGIAAAQTVILSLLARPLPAWVALPGLSVTRDNVVESFQTVWRQPAPREVIRVLGLAG
jgi:ribose transport system substrate-binding protein